MFRLCRFLSFSVILPLLFLMACAGQLREPEREIDTPKHHVITGFKLLEKKYYADAEREFGLALRLDPQNSSATRGLGILQGIKRQYEQALQSMEKARQMARNDEENALTYVGCLRIHIMQKKDNWLEKAEKNFNMAVSIQKQLPGAYYYMGTAYNEAGRGREARKLFNEVLMINKTHVSEAKQALEGLQ